MVPKLVEAIHYPMPRTVLVLPLNFSDSWDVRRFVKDKLRVVPMCEVQPDQWHCCDYKGMSPAERGIDIMVD